MKELALLTTISVGSIKDERKLTWDDTNGGAGDPSALIEVPLDAEDSDAIEEGEEEEKAGVNMEEQERLF